MTSLQRPDSSSGSRKRRTPRNGGAVKENAVVSNILNVVSKIADKFNVEEKIFTDDRVIFITGQNDTLYGIGFKSDVELNNWEIMQPTGVFNDGSDEQ